ncbi:MAG: triphosphoribosyl-dephospho-CoA synthase [Pirellulaceae bacterium]
MDLKNFTVGQLANLACTLEVMAPKPGNVHRAADFEDCSATDFLASGIAAGPVLDSADQQPLGQTIYDAIVATKVVTSHNTNLGIVLLIARWPKPHMLGGRTVACRFPSTCWMSCTT